MHMWRFFAGYRWCYDKYGNEMMVYDASKCALEYVCDMCLVLCMLQTVSKTSAASIAGGARTWGLTCMTTASLAVCV